MSKPQILVQLDSDAHPSVFDAVVAIDAGTDHLLQYGAVTADQVQRLVHGVMFTRGPEDLNQSAIFIGGSDVVAGEAILRATTDCFFGPLRVSVMMDASGANTTAAAAVVAAGRHLNLADATAAVLGATGPVGQRVVRLLAAEKAHVAVASRSLSRAEDVASRISKKVDKAKVAAAEVRSDQQLQRVLAECQLVIAAGAAGVELLPANVRSACHELKVLIDLNAVPPAGIAGIEVTDKAKQSEGVLSYGAIGVGGTKMKIHKAAIRRVFDSNDCVLDIDEIYQLGLALEMAKGQ